MLTFFIAAPLVAAHVSAFFINITLVIIADVHGLLWVLGKKKTLNRNVMIWLHRLIAAGLVVSIVTGAILASDIIGYLLTLPAFYTKLILVLALVVNSFVIGRHLHIATERPYQSLSAKERTPLFVSGAVSAVSWVGVFLAAQALGF